VRRTVILQAESGGEETFAFRVAEEIRARLVELQLPPPAPTSAPPATAAAPSVATAATVASALAPGPRATLGAAGGLGVSAAGGGTGATLHAGVALQLRLASGWGVTGRALLPLTAGRIAAAEGSATVRPYLFTAALDRLIWRRLDGWAASAGAGAGALLLDMRADAAPGFVGSTDRLAVAVSFVAADLRLGVARWLAVHAALTGGLTMPRPVLRFDGREVATWGRAFATATLGVDLTPFEW
jgi:hypothetical protein